MKYHDENFDYEKNRKKQWRKEHDAGGFRCSHCKRWANINAFIGTANRNHCPTCLWSKHVDEHKGDRKATCNGGMEPIGLTFKQEGYGKQGELMLIHRCANCDKISINRIARDDDNEGIVQCFEQSLTMEKTLELYLRNQAIEALSEHDRKEVFIQLYGR